MRCPRSNAPRALGSVLLAGVALALATLTVALALAQPSAAATEADTPLGEAEVDSKGSSRTHTPFPVALQRGKTYEMTVTGTFQFFAGDCIYDAIHVKCGSSPANPPANPQFVVSLENRAAANHQAPTALERLGTSNGGFGGPNLEVLDQKVAYNDGHRYRVLFTVPESRSARGPVMLWFVIRNTFTGQQNHLYVGGTLKVTIRESVVPEIRGRLAFNTRKNTIGLTRSFNKAPNGYVPTKIRLLGTVRVEGRTQPIPIEPADAKLLGNGSRAVMRRGISGDNAFFGRGKFGVTLAKGNEEHAYRLLFDVVDCPSDESRPCPGPRQRNRSDLFSFRKRNLDLGLFAGLAVVRVKVTKSDIPFCKKGSEGILAVSDLINVTKKARNDPRRRRATIDRVQIEVCKIVAMTNPTIKLRGMDSVKVFVRGLRPA